MFSRIEYIVIFFLLIALSSCNGKETDDQKYLKSIIGKNLQIPDGLVFQIKDDFMDYDLENADFKIITYIDSASCKACQMNLSKWDDVMNYFKSSENVDVNFLMVLGTSESPELRSLISSADFRHPVSFDPDNLFSHCNEIPSKFKYRTWLLDPDNNIVAVGNPATNPKIKELYSKIIFNADDPITEKSDYVPHPVKSLGIMEPNKRIEVAYNLYNPTDKKITIQDIVPSCDCIKVRVNKNTLSPNTNTDVRIAFVVDSVQGEFKRHIDIFFKELEKPIRLVMHGFIDN